MRAVQEEVTVELTASGKPARVTWRNRTLRVTDVVDEWRAKGRWWRREPPRNYALVHMGHVLAELYREDHDQGRWILARVVD